MAINNCYDRLTLKIPAEFPACGLLAKVRTNTPVCRQSGATVHSRTVTRNFEK